MIFFSRLCRFSESMHCFIPSAPYDLIDAKISCVIILLSNRTLSTRKRPVYKAFQKFLCHCATPFDTFFVNPFDALLSSQNRSQNRTATCTTHTPHPTMKISRLQKHLPELLFSLFFLLIFVLLSGTFATFFAIFIFLFKSLNRLFSRLSVYFKASYC